MKELFNANVEKPITDTKISVPENGMELNENTLEEVQFDELMKRLEAKKSDRKEYRISAYKEEPPCEVIERIVKSGNSSIKIVNPGFQYAEKICHFHNYFQGSISFSFYLGSYHSEVLKFWNPEMPSFWEIMSAIKLLNAYDFKVSVYCAPLDKDTFGLVEILTPFVDDIYIDLPYEIEDFLSKDDCDNYDKVIKVNEIMQNLTDEWVLNLVEKLKDNPFVKWGLFIDRIRKAKYYYS